MMTNDQCIRELISQTAIVQAYSDSHASKAMARLLELVIESYKLALIEVTPDQLPFIQGALKQTIALHLTVCGESDNPPKI